MSSDFHKESYERHSRLYDDLAPGGGRDNGEKWLREDTVDAWRHRRMHEFLSPLLEAWKGAHWITVGDGRYGSEARHIEQHGSRAVATDISDTLLEEAVRKGYITECSRQNAESLKYADNAFDIALCKESLHHFPRPFLALYEMMRVSRKAVVLVEPTDLRIGATLRWKLFRTAVDTTRGLTGRPGGHQVFEEAGNYVYGISRLELEKVALALNLPALALKGINDYYIDGLEDEKADRSSRLFGKIRRRIAINNLLCRFGLKPHTTTCAILFHQKPEEDLATRLKKDGFDFVKLPENPLFE